MKIKPTRICSRKGCNKEFKLYKSTDKHCSYECACLDQKEKPKKKQKAIPEYTEKRKRESYTYNRKRKVFMNKPENEFCPVCKAVFEGTIDSKDIFEPEFIFENEGFVLTKELHHKAGRRGKLLNYVPFWVAVSVIGHKWIHANPKKAYKLGFSIQNTTVNI